MGEESRVGPALLALLVVLAGCNFAPTGTPTTTPTESPTDVPTVTSSADSDLYDGLATDGVTDAWALTTAHEGALADTSFTAHRNRTERYANGTLRHSQRTAGRYASNHEQYNWRYTVASAPGDSADGSSRSATSYELWSNGSVTVTRMDSSTGTSYDRDVLSVRPNPTYRNRLTEILSAARTANVTPTTVNGSRAYRVVDRDVDDPRALLGGVSAPEGPIESVRDATVAAVVRPDGLIERAEVRVTVETEDETIEISESIRITNVGTTTVPRPEWVPTALDRTAE